MSHQVAWTFSAPQEAANGLLSSVRQMSGVIALLEPTEVGRRLTAYVGDPWTHARLDNVENVVRGFAPDAVRT